MCEFASAGVDVDVDVDALGIRLQNEGGEIICEVMERTRGGDRLQE